MSAYVHVAWILMSCPNMRSTLYHYIISSVNQSFLDSVYCERHVCTTNRELEACLWFWILRLEAVRSTLTEQLTAIDLQWKEEAA